MQIKSATIEQLEKDKPKGKCRKWRLWVNTVEGGRKPRRFAGTYSMAKRALDEYKQELGAVIPNSDTFGAYALARVQTRVASKAITPNTAANECRFCRMIDRSILGAMRMDAIKPADCRDALEWIRKNPQRPHLTHSGVISNTTMIDVYQFMRQTFQQATDDELLARNPMAKIKDPESDTPEVEALPWNELMGLLDWLDGKQMSGYVMALYLIACLALRRAESVAVIDAEVISTMLRVSEAVKERDGSTGDPKSKAGKRDLPVMPRLYRKVEECRRWKESRGLADAKTLACNVQGGTIRPQNLYRWWKKVTKGTKYDGVGLHQLRHSNLTHVARYMSPYDLMRYAGWSSLEPTRIYIHDDYESVHRSVSLAWGMSGEEMLRVAA